MRGKEEGEVMGVTESGMERVTAFVGQCKCLMPYADELTLPSLWFWERMHFDTPRRPPHKHTLRRFPHEEEGRSHALLSSYLHSPPASSARQLSRYVTRQPKMPIRPIYLSDMSPLLIPASFILFPFCSLHLPHPTAL